MLSAAGYAQEKLSLNDYLSRVQQADPEIKSLDLSIDAMGKKVLELDMVYSPYLSGGYNYLNDKSGPGFGSTLPTDKMSANTWDINASKKFSFGSTVSLGYTSTDAAFDLLAPAEIFPGLTTASFTGYQMKPFVQVQQSLLRDFKSGLTQSGIDKTKAATRAGQFMQLFKKQLLIERARTAYWTLSLSREVVNFRKVSQDRTEKLLKWNENRVKLDLADQSDLLQAKAAYRLRQLNLQTATEDEVNAARTFNEMLGISDGVVTYDLEKFQDKIPMYVAIKSLARTGQRADVLAARETYASSNYADKETYYRSLPELALTGSYSLTGIGLNYPDTWSQVTAADKPTFSVGINFIVPLDYRTLNKVRKGYKEDFYSAKEALNKAELSAQKDWDNLSKTWGDVKSRLLLSQEIKDIQEQRVANEQARFQKGRTTTFLLITAENDLDDATLNVYRNVLEAIITYAQAGLYNTQSSDIGGK
jgi:outer membrane protein TolC